MIAVAATRAFEEGARALFLEVSIANLAARRLYEGLGFHPVGARKAYYRQIGKAAEDATILKANLPLQPLGNPIGFD